MELAKGDWIDKRENLLLVGPSGTGKTHVAIALAMAAAVIVEKTGETEPGLRSPTVTSVRGLIGIAFPELPWRAKRSLTIAAVGGWSCTPMRERNSTYAFSGERLIR